MRKRLQEIAFDAGERLHRVLDENPRPLSLKSLKEGLLPLSDMDLIGVNKLVNGEQLIIEDVWKGCLMDQLWLQE